MSVSPTNTEFTSTAATNDGKNYTFALVSLTSLFFIWGFITALNDILIPHLKGVFSLNYTQTMLVQFCFFGAYFIVSIPAGKLIKKIGYQKGIVVGLIITSLGCVLFYPAAELQTYNIFLMALFVLASGITILQVSANPYVTALGNTETASSRLTMTQAFNSLGTTIAPFFGAALILGAATVSLEHMTSAEINALNAQSVQSPYLLIAAFLLILAAVFAKIKLPKLAALELNSPLENESSAPSIWSYSHLVLGAIAIFAYVGAEVSIGSFLINYIAEDNIAGFDEMQAAKYISYYWGGAMVGRFIGMWILQKFPAGKTLALSAVAACVLIFISVFSSGMLAMWTILAVGLFNSIMFPTIFSLSVVGLGTQTSQGSGILCLAIVGGAILPLVQGLLADSIGIQLSFLMSIVCYVYIVHFGLKGCIPKTDNN